MENLRTVLEVEESRYKVEQIANGEIKADIDKCYDEQSPVKHQSISKGKLSRTSSVGLLALAKRRSQMASLNTQRRSGKNFQRRFSNMQLPNNQLGSQKLPLKVKELKMQTIQNLTYMPNHSKSPMTVRLSASPLLQPKRRYSLKQPSISRKRVSSRPKGTEHRAITVESVEDIASIKELDVSDEDAD